jgi:hypothetical protein
MAALRFVLKLIVFAGVLGVVIGIFGYFRAVALVDTYRSASSCASPTDALTSQTCRYRGQARVLSTSSLHGPEARVAFDSLPGRTFHVGWATVGAPDSTLWTVGAAVDAELWDGVVTRLAGKPTGSDPETYRNTAYLELAAVCGGSSLLILLIWGLAAYKLQARKDQGHPT